MKKIYLFILCISLVSVTYGQDLKPVAQKIQKLRMQGVAFKDISLFTLNTGSEKEQGQLASIVTGATLLDFSALNAQQLLVSRSAYIHLQLPTVSGVPLELDLFQATIFTPDFSVTSSGSNGQPVAYAGGMHYWGIIQGDPNSIAAISIFNDEVMGMISTPSAGNLVLGKLANPIHGTHILYNDANMLVKPNIKCFTDEDGISYKKKDLNYQQKLITNCIRLFWEVNYDIFQNKGSVTNAANYVTGLFNQSAIIYANDGIPVELSEVYVWDTVSPYTATTTSAQLALFKSTRNSINGDLGHLLGLQGGGGVAAGFSGICNVNLDNSQCYSMVYTTYSNVPTYSWSIMVVTHEQGHLMGSRHTHACVWNGNNTAIDNCGPTAGYSYEGSCSGAPTPTNGGTIMSYCHAVGTVGINFSNGFGPQPIAVIMNNFNNGACLTSCIGTACMPSASMSTTNVLNTSATFNWNAVANANLYNIRYRVTGTSPWTTDTTSLTTYNAGGLLSGVTYEWQVQTVCSSGSSIYTISTTFTTIPLTCNTPGGTNTTNVASYSATLNWAAVSGALTYTIQYRIVGSGSWTSANTAATTYNVGSLTSITNYEWQVRANCSGGGTSAFSSSALFTTLAPPCLPPQNIYTTNITATSATFNWLPVSGATGYYTRYSVLGAGIWTNNFSAASPFNATGLMPATNYEWQILISCTGGQSPWGNSSYFTTLCSPPTSTITANGPTTFCSGGNVLLTASSGIGYTYQWYMNGNSLPGMVSMNFPANVSGSYSVVVTAGTCSATSAPVNVIVNPLPTVTAASVSGCDGTPINLSGSPAGGIYSQPNPYSGPSTTYLYYYTNGNGCSASSSPANITVNPLPQVSFTGLDTSYLVTAPPISLTGIPAGGVFSGIGISGNMFDPAAAGIGGPYTITYSYTDGNSCSASVSKPTSVINCPAPAQPGTITVVSGTSKVCPGDTRSYRVTNIPGLTYTWIPPAGSTITSGQGTNKIGVMYTSNFISNSSISVSAANSCGTGPSRTLNVNRNDPTTPASITGPVNGVCALSTVAYSTPAVAGITYNWSFDVLTASVSGGQGSSSVTADFMAGFINGKIRVSASNGCGTSGLKSLSVKSVPAKPGVIAGAGSVCANQTGVPYSISPVVNASSYKWTAPSGAKISDGIVTSTSNSLTTTLASVTVNFKTTAGNVTVKAGNSCGLGNAQTLAVAMPCRNGLDAFTEVSIYPNPSSGDFLIDIPLSYEENSMLQIFDATGRLIVSQQINQASRVIKNQALVPGMYTAVISNGSMSKQLKLVKTR